VRWNRSLLVRLLAPYLIALAAIAASVYACGDTLEQSRLRGLARAVGPPFSRADVIRDADSIRFEGFHHAQDVPTLPR
jgi:hypothetical protein